MVGQTPPGIVEIFFGGRTKSFADVKSSVLCEGFFQKIVWLDSDSFEKVT
jgi:hypothetical protein